MISASARWSRGFDCAVCRIMSSPLLLNVTGPVAAILSGCWKEGERGGGGAIAYTCTLHHGKQWTLHHNPATVCVCVSLATHAGSSAHSNTLELMSAEPHSTVGGAGGTAECHSVAAQERDSARRGAVYCRREAGTT